MKIKNSIKLEINQRRSAQLACSLIQLVLPSIVVFMITCDSHSLNSISTLCLHLTKQSLGNNSSNILRWAHLRSYNK